MAHAAILNHEVESEVLPRILFPVNDCVWKSFISYTFPSITVQKPPSLLWFSKSALRICVTSSLFLQFWPVKNDSVYTETKINQSIDQEIKQQNKSCKRTIKANRQILNHNRNTNIPLAITNTTNKNSLKIWNDYKTKQKQHHMSSINSKSDYV